jgi:FixJ family two-component response regulator
VVEDRYLLASEMVRMLRELHCTVVGPAPDLASGLGVLEREATDLDCAVLDVDLRGETVYPLASALLERGIPLAFATGYSAGILPEPWSTFVRLEKPFDARMLAKALRVALRAPRKAGRALAPRAAIAEQSEQLKNIRNSVMEWRAVRRRPQEDLPFGSLRLDAAAKWQKASSELVAQARATLGRARDAIALSRGRRQHSEDALRTSRNGEDTQDQGGGGGKS